MVKDHEDPQKTPENFERKVRRIAGWMKDFDEGLQDF